jgi:ABC-2 type transport system permease protein
MRIKENFIAYQTILLNEVKRTIRLWSQTILPPAMTSALYFLIFGQLMGERIGQMSGLPYIDFIVPGLIIMNMLTASYNASVFVLYMAKFNRSIEELLVSPTSTMTILIAYMSVGIMRGLLVGIMVAIVAKIFTGFTVDMPWFMIFVAVISCGLFSLLGVLNAMYAKTFDQVSIIPTFVIGPLSYLGGIFYSLSILPPFWAHVALFNPLVYIISSFRYAFYGIHDTSILLSVSTIVILFVILFMMNLRLIKKRIGFSD